MDGVLIVQGGAKDAAVTGFDPSTGELLWSAGEDRVGYQSPVPLQQAGDTVLLAASNARLFGIEPGSGKVLWEYEHGGNSGPGAQSLVPVLADNGRIFLAHKDDGSTMVQLSITDGVAKVEPVWDGRSIRNSYNVPIYHDGHLYAFSSRILTCVDASSGEPVWRSRLPGDGFLILVDGHLVILTKSGELHVAPATPDGYQEIGSLTLFTGLAWSPPSFAGGSIYLRSLGELARVDLASAESSGPVMVDGGPALAGSALATRLAALASAEDSAAAIDAFMEEVKEFPLIEGRDTVHFIYRGPGDDLAVGSDLFGARQERSMRRLPGTDLFTYSAHLEADARVNYIFMRDYEEIRDPRNQRTTVTYLLGKDMEMNFGGEGLPMSWLSMPDWQEPAYLQPAPAAQMGTLETGEIESTALEAAVSFTVYKPSGYDQGTQRLPVAYVHGGQSARENGLLPNSLDNLIGKQVEPVLVVFIDSARAQSNEPYLKMVNEELIPHIDATYRTAPEAARRAHVGMGPAAFAALYCAMKQPGIADRAGTQSIFMFGPAMSQITEIVNDSQERNMTLYLDWSLYDLRNPQEAWDLGQMNQELAALLGEHGYPTQGGVAHDGIGWPSWRNRTGALFMALFPLEGDGAPAGAN